MGTMMGNSMEELEKVARQIEASVAEIGYALSTVVAHLQIISSAVGRARESVSEASRMPPM